MLTMQRILWNCSKYTKKASTLKTSKLKEAVKIPTTTPINPKTAHHFTTLMATQQLDNT